MAEDKQRFVVEVEELVLEARLLREEAGELEQENVWLKDQLAHAQGQLSHLRAKLKGYGEDQPSQSFRHRLQQQNIILQKKLLEKEHELATSLSRNSQLESMVNRFEGNYQQIDKLFKDYEKQHQKQIQQHDFYCQQFKKEIKRLQLEICQQNQLLEQQAFQIRKSKILAGHIPTKSARPIIMTTPTQEPRHREYGTGR